MSSVGEFSTFSDEHTLSILEALSHEQDDTLILFEDLKIKSGDKELIVKRHGETIGSNVSIQYNFVRDTTPEKNVKQSEYKYVRRMYVDENNLDKPSKKNASEKEFFKKLITGLHLNELCHEYEHAKHEFITQLEKFKNLTNVVNGNETTFDFQKELAMNLLDSIYSMIVFESEHTKKIVVSDVDSKAKLKQLLNLYKSHFKFSYVLEEKLLACIDDFVEQIRCNYHLNNNKNVVYCAENIARKFVQMKKSRVHMLQQMNIVNETVNSESLSERHLYGDLLHKIILDCEDTNMKAYKLRVFHNDLKELKDYLLKEMPDFNENDNYVNEKDVSSLNDLKNILTDLENRLEKAEKIALLTPIQSSIDKTSTQKKPSKTSNQDDDVEELTNVIKLLKGHDEIMSKKYTVLNDKVDGLKNKLNKCEEKILHYCEFVKNIPKINSGKITEKSNDSLSNLALINNKSYTSECQKLEQHIMQIEKEVEALHTDMQSSSNNSNDAKVIVDFFALNKKIEEAPTINLKEYDALVEEVKQLENKYAEQKKLIGPYKEQLQQYKAERSELMMETEKNKQVLENKHLIIADVIGHQNKNQKIKHVHMVIKKHFELKEQSVQLSKVLAEKSKEVEELKEKCLQDPNCDISTLFKTPSPTKRKRFSSTPPVWKLTIPNSPLDKYESPKSYSPQAQQINTCRSPVSSRNATKPSTSRNINNVTTTNSPTVKVTPENSSQVEQPKLELSKTPQKVSIKEVLDSSYNELTTTIQIRI